MKDLIRMNQLAGVITEGQAKKMMRILNEENEENEDEIPLTPKVKSFINKAISDSKKDGEFENLKKVDWFENELIDELIDLFLEEDKDYDRASKEVKDYIKSKIS
jgi:hypothetical protein